MKEYKIDRENKQETPSSETISKFKNFGQLSHEYDRLTKKPKVPLYKDKKMFLVLLLIVLVAFILAQVDNEKEGGETTVSPEDTVVNDNRMNNN